MKIVIDVRCLMDNQYSGVSYYTLNLLKSMFELDRNNEYLLFYNSSKPVKMPEFNYPNVRYKGFNYSNKLFNLSLLLRGRPKIDEMLGECDIFFTPNLNFLALSDSKPHPSPLLGKERKIKKILTIHDLSFLRFPEFFNWKMRAWHRLVLTPPLPFGHLPLSTHLADRQTRGKKISSFIDQFDIITADSNSTKNDIIELLGVSNEKIKVIYLGVGEEFKVLSRPLPDPPFSTRSADRQTRGGENKFILFLGTLEPRKNVESIIEAYNQLDLEHNLVIAGGRGWKNKKIFKLAKDNPRIKFIDYIADKDKPVLYNQADLFICPSYYEGFGLPFLEAMACGTPVIGGNNSSQVEVIGDAGLLVDPYNINEIKEAIKVMLEDKELRNKFIKKGLERVKEFTWYKTAEQMLRIFN